MKFNTLPIVSYREFLDIHQVPDCRESWILWKFYCCNVGYGTARKMSYNKEWGYTPLETKGESV